jgi:hypothetical protein
VSSLRTHGASTSSQRRPDDAIASVQHACTPPGLLKHDGPPHSPVDDQNKEASFANDEAKRNRLEFQQRFLGNGKRYQPHCASQQMRPESSMF